MDAVKNNIPSAKMAPTCDSDESLVRTENAAFLSQI
jgi:hypothetical protein